MSSSRKLVLLAAMALAALALSASAASASPIEIESEPGEDHCATICDIHVAGSSRFDLYSNTTFLGTLWACTDEFTSSLDENGEGTTVYSNNYPNGGCARTNCDGADAIWPTEITESDAGVENAHIVFCLENGPGAANDKCEVNVSITTPGDVHHYVVTANHEICGPPTGVHLELTGSWEVEDGDDWELVHL